MLVDDLFAEAVADRHRARCFPLCRPRIQQHVIHRRAMKLLGIRPSACERGNVDSGDLQVVAAADDQHTAARAADSSRAGSMAIMSGLALGFPVGVLLALGRRSSYAVPRLASTAIVEVVRGVPLVAVLYLAVLVVPLALSSGVEIDKLVLAQGGVAVFAAAYLAEAVRSGLQVVPARRADAARALGLSWWQATRLVVLPEALRIVVPSFVSIAVGFFQDTSLIVIIGLFDLLNTARLAAQDPAWLGFHTEAYVFVGVIYFAVSALVSRYGLWIERRLGKSARRV